MWVLRAKMLLTIYLMGKLYQRDNFKVLSIYLSVCRLSIHLPTPPFCLSVGLVTVMQIPDIMTANSFSLGGQTLLERNTCVADSQY